MTRKLTAIEAAAMMELRQRRCVSLSAIRPYAHQEPIFTEPYTKYLAILGGNRSGKSLMSAALVSAIATDTPITLRDGRQVDCRRPWQKNRCLNIWIIGIRGDHIGQTIYRLLFRADAFKVTYDEHDGRLRTWDRKLDGEAGIVAKASPPFIPSRYCKNWVWENKGAREFKSVQIVDPTTQMPLANIFAYSSMGEVKTGDPVDVLWIDEQVDNPAYVPDWKARLLDNNGIMIWSSWPDMSNEALQEMERLANDPKHAAMPLAKVVRLPMDKNESLSSEAIDGFLGAVSEEERQARNLGLFLTDQIRLYPNFDAGLHTALVGDGINEDRLSRVIRENGGEIPYTWTRDLILDPGTQHPAVLLCAVPPPDEFGEYYVVYDEIYPGRADAMQLAKIVRGRTMGQNLHRMICDFRAGRQQTMGMMNGHRVVDAYADAFAAESIRCSSSGARFIFADDNVPARVMKLQGWMHTGPLGQPRLRVHVRRCPSLCEQLKKVKKKCVNKEIVDRPADGQQIDLVTCLEYWAASHPKYVPYRAGVETYTPVYKWFMEKFGNKPIGSEGFSVGTSYVPR